MSAAFLQQAPAWLALALLLGAIAVAAAAIIARSLMAVALYFAVAALLIAAALMGLNAGDASLGFALFGLGLAPFALLGVLLLSVRAVKQRRSAFPWPSVVAAVAAAAAILWVAPDLGATAPAMTGGAIAPWLAPLMFVAGAAALGLIGFGERGVFERAPQDEIE